MPLEHLSGNQLITSSFFCLGGGGVHAYLGPVVSLLHSRLPNLLFLPLSLLPSCLLSTLHRKHYTRLLTCPSHPLLSSKRCLNGTVCVGDTGINSVNDYEPDRPDAGRSSRRSAAIAASAATQAHGHSTVSPAQPLPVRFQLLFMCFPSIVFKRLPVFGQ